MDHHSALIHRLSSAASAIAVCAAMSASAVASPNILALGDSITQGYGSNNGGDSNGGYRFYLDMLVNGGYTFIGNRDAGETSFANNLHWSQGGARPQKDYDVNGNPVPSMLRAIHNITADPTSDLAAFNPANGKVDAVLVHAGTNNDLRTTGQQNEAWDQMYALLHGGNVTGSPILGNITNALGIDAQLSNSANANPNARVFVAGIIPRLDTGFAQQERIDRWVGSGTLNSWVKNDLLPTLAGSSVTYEYVDMFSIRLNELNLVWLADQFTAGDIPALVALLSPDDDTQFAGVDYDYVDWGIGFNEHSWDEGAMGSLPPGFTFGGVNTNLYYDSLHPTDLGYAVMANVWYNALVAHYGIPEPATAALLLLGVGGLTLRRRA